MYIFYTPEVLQTSTLPEEESSHCVRVLRLKEGDEVMLTDGLGSFYRAIITEPHPSSCKVDITETIPQVALWTNRIEIAMAPTKNMERTEWFVEKATEIGINKISFLKCRFSERKEVKLSRIEKILISAMKQSLKAYLPDLQNLTDFKAVVNQDFDGRKFIAHCYPVEPKPLLSQVCHKGENVLVLIGPEGDFSEEEVSLAIQYGFEPVSLGTGRLRTETAALVACHTIQVINQL